MEYLLPYLRMVTVRTSYNGRIRDNIGYRGVGMVRFYCSVNYNKEYEIDSIPAIRCIIYFVLWHLHVCL